MESVLPESTRHALIEQHTAFVHKVVRSTMRILRLPQINYDDYASAGFFGLVEAAERYDTTTGVSFRGYAYLRVRGAIIDSIRKDKELSGENYRRAQAIQALEEDEQDLIKSLEASEVSAVADVFSFAAKAFTSLRLQEVSTEEGGDERFIDPEIISLHQEKNSVLRSLVQELPEKERYIIEAHYFREKTFAEISHERPELSRSWISRLHSRALERLQILMIERYYHAS